MPKCSKKKCKSLNRCCSNNCCSNPKTGNCKYYSSHQELLSDKKAFNNLYFNKNNCCSN